MPKQAKETADIGDQVVVHWVDHCEYEDVPLAHESFHLIRFSTFGQLLHMDDEKIHLGRTVHVGDGGKNTVLIIGRGMVTGIDLYRKIGPAELP